MATQVKVFGKSGTPATLYPRERQVLEYVTQHIQRFGYAPTLKEICEALNVSSVATVHEHLEHLRRKGYIRKLDGQMRGIEVVEGMLKTGDKEGAPELPILGFIAAGAPLEPHTDPNLYMKIPPGMVHGNKAAYILQVKGTSMVDDGILDGDYVVIQHQETAKNGDIVVALLPNGFATLKRIYYEKDHIKLIPANSTMSPIVTTHVKIQGRCVGIIRRFADQ